MEKMNMVFLGIVLIILCLLLFGALSNINKIDSELKEEIKEFSKELIEDTFQAGYKSGFESAEGKIHVESCQQYIERKMKELDNEIK
jgi:flagellar biosynthesis/type III secretory pathway protein FliH